MAVAIQKFLQHCVRQQYIIYGWFAIYIQQYQVPTVITNADNKEGSCLLARESKALLTGSGSMGVAVGADVVGALVCGAGYTRNVMDCPISQ
jgi:hypothetical protein